jgi:hypothetical protein
VLAYSKFILFNSCLKCANCAFLNATCYRVIVWIQQVYCSRSLVTLWWTNLMIARSMVRAHRTTSDFRHRYIVTQGVFISVSAIQNVIWKSILQKQVPNCPKLRNIHQMGYAASRIYVLATTKPAARIISILFRKRQFNNSYLAMVQGHMSKESIQFLSLVLIHQQFLISMDHPDTVPMHQ